MSNPPTAQLPNHRSTQNIAKLARLVDINQRASIDEIASVVKEDSELTGPIMRRAYPKAPIRQEATLQMATSRVGINYIIVLLITDLITQYVLEVFQEMAGIYLRKDDPSLMLHEGRSYLVATVPFKGKASGTLHFVFSSAMSMLVADRVLKQGEEMTIENINAALEEITGVIAQHVQTGLTAGRMPCTVDAPVVTLMDSFPEERIPGGTNEEFYFSQGSNGLRVHLSVQPFSLGR